MTTKIRHTLTCVGTILLLTAWSGCQVTSPYSRTISGPQIDLAGDVFKAYFDPTIAEPEIKVINKTCFTANIRLRPDPAADTYTGNEESRSLTVLPNRDQEFPIQSGSYIYGITGARFQPILAVKTVFREKHRYEWHLNHAQPCAKCGIGGQSDYPSFY